MEKEYETADCGVVVLVVVSITHMGHRRCVQNAQDDGYQNGFWLAMAQIDLSDAKPL